MLDSAYCVPSGPSLSTRIKMDTVRWGLKSVLQRFNFRYRSKAKDGSIMFSQHSAFSSAFLSFFQPFPTLISLIEFLSSSSPFVSRNTQCPNMKFTARGCWPLTWLPLVALIVSAQAQADGESASTCISAGSVTTIHVVEAIYVSTFVQQNTTFSIYDYLTLTVDSAPTALGEVVTRTTTTVISSVSFILQA